MGACRESKNIFWYIKLKQFRKVWRLIKRFDKETYEDTVMPTICKIKGHKPYQVNQHEEQDEWACKRCHRYINYNPRLEKLKRLKKISKC